MDIIDSPSSHHHQQHPPHYQSSSTSANECDVITSLNSNHEKSKYPTTSPTRRPAELLPPKTLPSEVPPSSKLPLITEQTYNYGDNGNNHNNASSRSSLSFFSDTYHVTTKKKTVRKPPILQRWLSSSSSTTTASPTSTPPDDMPVTRFPLDMTTTERMRNTGGGCTDTSIIGKIGLSNSLSSLLVVSSMLSTSKLISSSSSQSDISKMPSTSSSTSPVSSSPEISSQRGDHNSRGMSDRDKERRPEGEETRIHRKISNSLPDISSSDNPSIHSNSKRNSSTRTCDHTINDEDDDESTLESSLYHHHHHHHHHRRHHSHQGAEQVDEDLSDGEESTSLFTSVSCDDGIFSAADISSPSSSSSNSSESSSSSSTSSTVNEVVLDSKTTIITATDMTGRSSKVRKSSIGKTTNEEEEDFDFGIQEDEDFPDTYLDGQDVENEVPSDGEDITPPKITGQSCFIISFEGGGVGSLHLPLEVFQLPIHPRLLTSQLSSSTGDSSMSHQLATPFSPMIK